MTLRTETVATGRRQWIALSVLCLAAFTRLTFSVTLGSMTAYSMLSGGVMVFVAQYFQLVQGMTPLAAGLALVPGMLMTTVAFQLAPRLAQRVRPGLLIPAGIAFTVAGMIMMSLATSTTLLVIAFAIQCVGPAPLVTLGTNLVIGSVPPEKAGSAGALTQTGNEFGYSLGIAVLGSVVTAVYRGHMDGRGGNSLGEAITQGASGDLLDQARNAFTNGLHLAAGIAALALAAVAVVLAVTLRAVPALSRR